MKVFVTGSTGLIGSRVTELLLEAGHEVTALVRNEAKVEALRAKGVDVVLGDLRQAKLVAETAAKADATVGRGPSGFVRLCS